MKKKLVVLLSMVFLVLSTLCACGNKTNEEDFCGTWVRETYTNEKTGAVIDITLILYEDGTYEEKISHSVDGYKEYHGSWELKNEEIILNTLKLVEGEDPSFGEDGRLLDGISNQQSVLEVVDSTTLTNNNINYNKQH